MRAAHRANPFVPPMLLRRVTALPEGPNWTYEVKWDGYRMQAIRLAVWSMPRKSAVVSGCGSAPDYRVVLGAEIPRRQVRLGITQERLAEWADLHPTGCLINSDPVPLISHPPLPAPMYPHVGKFKLQRAARGTEFARLHRN